MSSFKFGRSDSLSDALQVKEWPEFFSRDGSIVRPFTDAGFDGSTRFRNYSQALSNEELPELYGSKGECCGCGACVFKCPVHAIAMFPDEEGFLYPVVDADLCIGCKACMDICPLKR